MIDKLELINNRYDQLNELMAQPEVISDLDRLQDYAREQSGISTIVDRYRVYREVGRELDDARVLLEESTDEEMKSLAKEEIAHLRQRQEEILDELRALTTPKDPNDEKDVIVEIRAGAGGDEAGLFAAELFRMYSRYADSQRWKVEILNSNSGSGGIGAFKEVIFEVKGRGAYSRLKYESGVHRVQRVPVTESSGRIHTSTATVIVMPEAEEVDLEIRDEDLRIDVYRSSGHGGQSVNTTDSAIRITHIPSGLVVTCQDEKSQLKNKLKGMNVLRSRLLDLERLKRETEQGEARRSQVRSGDRSEKIRTYNYPQDRITDHRINQNFSNLPGVLEGNLAPMLDALKEADSSDYEE